MSTTQRYQHAKTLLVGEYTPEFAAIFPDLVLVADGSKPRAYTAIEQAHIDALHEQASEENAALDALEQTSKPDPAPAVVETPKTKAKSA